MERKEGDHVNAVRHCFNLGSFYVFWFMHVMCEALYGRTTLNSISKSKS